jgi:hypothetical protein
MTIMTLLTGMVGFASPIAEKTNSKRRYGVELFATLALAVSLFIAATAVSIGVARAQILNTHDLNASAAAWVARVQAQCYPARLAPG